MCAGSSSWRRHSVRQIQTFGRAVFVQTGKSMFAEMLFQPTGNPKYDNIFWFDIFYFSMKTPYTQPHNMLSVHLQKLHKFYPKCNTIYIPSPDFDKISFSDGLCSRGAEVEWSTPYRKNTGSVSNFLSMFLLLVVMGWCQYQAAVLPLVCECLNVIVATKKVEMPFITVRPSLVHQKWLQLPLASQKLHNALIT